MFHLAFFHRASLRTLTVVASLGTAWCLPLRSGEAMQAPTPAAHDTTPQDLMTAPTPSACLQIAGALFGKDMRTLHRAEVNANYRTNAATCGRRFDPATVDSAQLWSATALYQIGHLDREYFIALDRTITVAKTRPDSAQAITQAIMSLMGSHDVDETPSWIERAEYYLEQLERIPHVHATQLLTVHETLTWLYPPGDPHRAMHLAGAERAVRAMSRASQRTPEGREAMCGFDNLKAIAAADADDFAGAVSAMDHCLSLWPKANAKHGSNQEEPSTWRKTRQQYAFVGQHVPAELAAPYWLNAPDGMTKADLSQPVTLVEFTWTGCPECHKGYPALRSIYTKYRDRGVHPMFMTYLFQQTPQHDTATAEQELAYDEHFWRDDKPIPFPIGVLAAQDTATRARGEAYVPLFQTYAVIGAPTYYVIDRHGIIRYVQSGHRKDLEAKLSGIIERLLRES